MLAKRPETGVYLGVIKKFSPEGFLKVNVMDTLLEVGYSKAEANRLFNSRAIKVWDTRVTEDGNHFEWYKRTAGSFELLETGDDRANVIIVGNHRAIIVGVAKRFPLLRLFYFLRPYFERYILEPIGIGR